MDSNNAIEIELMSGRRSRKKEVVQIDADWLLGKSVNPSSRDFSWFRRIVVSLICIVAAVWSWPYASQQWLKWEWQQQLADTSGKQSEDVLPILLALNELGSIGNAEIVEQMASADYDKRSMAFHLLEQRIKQWRQKTPSSASEIISLVDALGSERIRSPESLLLRGQLAAQLQPILNDFPGASKLLASVDAMIIRGERSGMPNDTAARSTIPLVKSTAMAATIRINDNGPIAVDSIDPPNLNKVQSLPPTVVNKVRGSGPVLTSMRTLTDQATSTSIAQLPNLSISIPRTVSKAVIVQAPLDSIETTDASAASIESTAHDSPELTVINGIEKRNLEGLLPLLTSAQTRIVQQALIELGRRGMTTSQLEIAMTLAQGDVEQRLKALETIAKDPNFDAIPWLAWMAGGADRTVRLRAIVLLGSMTDPDALRKLRILKSREPDGAIADKISQVLLASGTAASSIR